MEGETWYCKRCHANQPAETDSRNRPKVRRFATGFVAVFLTCGHTAAVTAVHGPATSRGAQR